MNYKAGLSPEQRLGIRELIKQERKKRALTQTEFAQLLDVSQQVIADWESGRSLPRLSSIATISEKLGLALPALSKPTEQDESTVDRLFLATWKQLSASDRKKLLQIALIITNE